MSPRTLQLRSPAKINLWLKILGRREDGFHSIETRMCPISLSDEVRLTLKEEGNTTLTCSDSTVPTDNKNLAIKALNAFETRTKLINSWGIHLEKRIPHGAGLGGGSSNAATVLLGANELCGNPLDFEELVELAGQIGSDVPFFLYGKTCDASGRGEVVEPVSNFSWKLPLVLIKPPFGIPTPWAYQRWRDSPELRGVSYAPQECPWGLMVNDLEKPVFEKWTLLPTLKAWLLDQPETKAALMSGSGSTLFAVTQSGADAADLTKRAQELCGPTTRVLTATTL